MSAELSIQGLDSANRSFGRETKATNSDIRREVTNTISKALKLDSLEAAAKSKNCSSPQRGGSPTWAPKHQPQPLRDSPIIAPQTPSFRKLPAPSLCRPQAFSRNQKHQSWGPYHLLEKKGRGQLFPIQPPSLPGSLAWEAKTS
nr:myosin light chain kinase, smooth muscle-like [Saimiri boliviensis boliviensis]